MLPDFQWSHLHRSKEQIQTRNIDTRITLQISSNIKTYHVYISSYQVIECDSVKIIKTPMHPQEAYPFLASLHPIGRMGEIQDIVEAVLFLEKARFVTGEILHVDGCANAGRRWRRHCFINNSRPRTEIREMFVRGRVSRPATDLPLRSA